MFVKNYNSVMCTHQSSSSSYSSLLLFFSSCLNLVNFCITEAQGYYFLLFSMIKCLPNTPATVSIFTILSNFSLNFFTESSLILYKSTISYKLFKFFYRTYTYFRSYFLFLSSTIYLFIWSMTLLSVFDIRFTS